MLLANLVQWRVNMLTCQALISREVEAQRARLERLVWKLEAMR